MTTPRTTGSVGPNVDKFGKSEQREAKSLPESKEVHVEIERLSFTPAVSTDNATSKLPPVASSRLVCPDKNGLLVNKTAQNRPQNAVATPRPPLSTTKHSCEPAPRSDETETTTGNETIHTTTTTTKAAKETEEGTGSAVSDAAEAARRKRQEQQRLQKEMWQKKHELAAGKKKRTSDAAEQLSPGEGEEEEGGGGVVDSAFLDADGLISAGIYSVAK